MTSLIDCSGAVACLIDLSDVNRPVVIFGGPGSQVGLRRTDSYTYPLVQVARASGVTVANLLFDEGPEAPSCDPAQVNGVYTFPCRSTISVSSSSNVLLRHLTLLNAKDHAIEVSSSSNVVIRDSQIRNAGVFGIWTGGDASTTSTTMLVENNLIQDVRSNGIYLSYTNAATIHGNTLRHNHRVALFNDCAGLCPGGQIDILHNDNLDIEANQVLDGVIDLNNATGQTSGIEINENQHHVRIANNEIGNNRGTGIYANPGAIDLSDFVITGNSLYGNTLPFWGLDTKPIQLSDNCFSPPVVACTVPPAFAGLQTVAGSGPGACSLSLSWSPATAACGSAVGYNVYRSLTPAFTPSLENRIARCVPTTSYTNSLVAGATTYYFKVRAEDNSGSGAGPCGGNEEANVAERSAATGLSCSRSSHQFYTVVPCRILDTRNTSALAANRERSFAVAGQCGVPASAKAVSVNLTVTQATTAGNLRLYPVGAALPQTSNLNYAAGQTRANNAASALGDGGALTVLCNQASGTAHAILDVNGYFE